MKRILIAFAVFGMVASIGLVAGVGSASAQELASNEDFVQTGSYDFGSEIDGPVVEAEETENHVVALWIDESAEEVWYSAYNKSDDTVSSRTIDARPYASLYLDHYHLFDMGNDRVGVKVSIDGPYHSQMFRIIDNNNLFNATSNRVVASYFSGVFVENGQYKQVIEETSGNIYEYTYDNSSLGPVDQKDVTSEIGGPDTLSDNYMEHGNWKYNSERDSYITLRDTDQVRELKASGTDEYGLDNYYVLASGLGYETADLLEFQDYYFVEGARNDNENAFSRAIVDISTEELVYSGTAFNYGNLDNHARSEIGVTEDDDFFMGMTDADTLVLHNGSGEVATQSITDYDPIGVYDTSGGVALAGDTSSSTPRTTIETYDVETASPTDLNLSVEKENLNLSEDGPTDFNFSGTITYDDGTTQPLTSDDIGIVAYTSGVIDVDTTSLTYSISPDFDGDPNSTDFSVSLADSDVSATSPTITVDYRPPEVVVSNLTLEQPAFETNASETVTGTFRLVNEGDLPTNVTLYQGIDGFEKTTTNGSVTYNANTTGSYSFDVPSAKGNYTANVTSISENGFTSTTTAEIRVVDVSGPTVEITSIETTDNEPYNDPEGTVTISVKHNSLNDSVRSASISPNFTDTTQQVSFGEIPALGTATETVTLNDQPPIENTSGDYTVITEGDSATFTIQNVIGTPSLSNLRNPAFSNMDRVIAVLGDTTLIILFLITGASAMVSKETSGSIGSVMFMLLLLPAWLAVGVPLYLFGVAIPAVVIIYQQSQSDQPAQEIRIEGMR